MGQRKPRTLEVPKVAMELSELFREDERFIEIKDVKPEELLDQEGILSCSQTMSMLDIDRRKAFALLRKESRKRGGEAAYLAKFGIKKYGTSRWFLHMPTFRDFVEEFKQRFPVVARPKVSKLPNKLTRAKFFQLDGIYFYRQIMDLGFLPFEPDQLLRHITKLKIPQEDCGVWKEGNDFYVDFKPFLAFAYALKEEITLEKARKLVFGTA